jgi:UDP:flavonoid glycosyltransferase YjiC (YdhE family)
MSFDTPGDRGLAQTLIAAIGETGNAGIIQGFDNSITSMTLPDYVLRLGPFPHDVLFPHASLIVHHGGFGTLTTAVLAGKPSVVVPHGFDQPFWAARAYALGLTPKPVPATKANLTRLSAAIEAATRDSDIEVNVQRMMQKLKQEHGLVEARQRIEEFARHHRGSGVVR